eukprot:TRINITY_DN373_c0_g1_i1.p2 TRINITY_DN373_c0_g1~~TRINITY_DN373_c0_g1_i1.p2  ORF type:complete len:257 (-),score=42.18 TRINITY_DN373_c0_g1_i1:754-1524(-)
MSLSRISTFFKAFSAKVLAPPINPVAVTMEGKIPIWTKGYKVVYSNNIRESMNELADILNEDLPLELAGFKSKDEALKHLCKLLQAIGKPAEITTYAATTTLYHGTKMNMIEKKLINSLLIPCLEQKLEYIDSRGLSQALWSFKETKELANHPIVEMLTAKATQKDASKDVVMLKTPAFNANKYKLAPKNLEEQLKDLHANKEDKEDAIKKKGYSRLEPMKEHLEAIQDEFKESIKLKKQKSNSKTEEQVKQFDLP